MSKVLFQITEDQVRSLAERECQFLSVDAVDEIVEALEDMVAEAVIMDAFILYVVKRIKKQAIMCTSCEELASCELGQKAVQAMMNYLVGHSLS